MRRAVREFGGGVADLGRGFRLWAASPRAMLLGAVPALVVAVAWIGLLVLLWSSLDPVAAALTPFAAGWPLALRAAVRVLAGVVVVVASLTVAVLSYTGVVLAVGDPVYERIGAAVERRLGGAPEAAEQPLLRGLLRAAGEGLRLLLASVLVGLLTLLLGLVPVVGPALAAVVGALLGGWYLALELTGTAFERRGLAYRDRRAVLGRHRARSLGLGVATWLVFLVPLGAVVAMPAAVAGATLLTRRALAPGQPTGSSPVLR